jgi:hypothetical protein
VTLDDYKALKRRLDDLQRTCDRSQGAVEQLKSRMKKELGADSVPEAEKKLKELKRRQVKLDEEIVKEKEKWDRKWKDKLEEM